MLLLVINSYLLGSIPFAYISTKLFKNADIRKIGSKNVGTTNVMKNIGVIPGVITAIGDASKGILAVLIGDSMMAGGGLIGLLLAVIGHNWPVWLGFYGGGGLATMIGGLLLVSKWWIILILIGIWGLAFLIMKNHDESAIVACSFSPFVLGYFHASWQYFFFGLLAGFVVGIKRFFSIKANEKAFAIKKVA